MLKKDPNKYIKYTKDRLYNDKRYSVSSEKIRELGWKPKRTIKEGLKETIQWYMDPKNLDE